MRGSIILIVIVSAVIGLFAYSYLSQGPGKNKEQTIQEKVAKAGGMIQNQTLEFGEKAGDLAQQAQAGAEQLAKQTAATVEAQKENVAALGEKLHDTAAGVQQQAMAVTTTAKETAEGLAVKIKELLEKAQAFLNNGEYQQATEYAQNALNLDPASAEAKRILETAKEKIAALATEKASEFKTGIADKVGEAKAALGTVGQ